MAAMYAIVKNSNTSFSLKELKSGNIIDGFKSWAEARRQSVFLTAGGGFNGWTPNFIIKNNVKTETGH